MHSYTPHMREILQILADNVRNNLQPECVQSRHIAQQLCLPLSETKQILQAMHDLGMVENGFEAEYCLITRSGMQQVEC